MKESLLESGRDAASAGDWHQAYECLMEADAGHFLDGADLALLAGAAYAAGHVDVTIAVWERAYTQCLRAGDRLEAADAATRVAMHLLFDTALMAPVRGWVKRAERLLEDQDETPAHAWLAVVRSYERMLSGDFEEAGKYACRAVEVGARCNPAAAALGRIAEARCRILTGDVEEGIERLNEAAVAAVSGELDPLTTGIVYCELVCALQALAQYDLAEEWTQAMERWQRGQPVGSLHGRCRVHRAEILRLRGSNREAEKEVLLACDELRPYLRRELGWPLTELGRIRLRTGDLDGAEQAFLAAHRAGWDPQPGLAMVYLARGHVELATASIRDAIEHPSNVPSKELPPNSGLRLAPLLEAQVEISIAAGDLDRARWAADEMEKVVALFGSKALECGVAGARASVKLAEGDAGGARRDFEAALHGWSDIGAPYEAAIARMGIALTHLVEGRKDRALLEFQAAHSAFREIGALHRAERAAIACAQLLDPQADPDLRDRADAERLTKPAQHVEGTPVGIAYPEHDNVFRRDGEYWTVTYAGETVLLRDGKGIRYLSYLLADPGREFHVLDLVAVERDWTPDESGGTEVGLESSALGDAGELLDARAKTAYRRRLREIEEDIEEAREIGDVEREAQAVTEHDILIRELSRAVGLGGRDRRAGSASERARAGVTRAVRSAMSRIREQNPPLGVHLERSIRTGTYCAYLPDPRAPAAWKF